jgi:hypothetical protein
MNVLSAEPAEKATEWRVRPSHLSESVCRFKTAERLLLIACPIRHSRLLVGFYVCASCLLSMAKILLTGATGTIGRAVLDRCLTHPNVDTVVAFVRRALPDEIATNPKIQTVIVKDFSVWPEDVLTQHLDAAAMIWFVSTTHRTRMQKNKSLTTERCLGDWEGQPEVVLDYPLAFQIALINLRRRTAHGEQISFRYIHLSGKLTEQDQSKSLYYFAENRKLKVTKPTHITAISKTQAVSVGCA